MGISIDNNKHPVKSVYILNGNKLVYYSIFYGIIKASRGNRHRKMRSPQVII